MIQLRHWWINNEKNIYLWQNCINTFIYSGGAGDWGITTLKFTSDNYEYNIIGSCESDDKGISYFIDNNQGTEEAFDTFCNEQKEKSNTEWYEFSQESIEVELSSD